MLDHGDKSGRRRSWDLIRLCTGVNVNFLRTRVTSTNNRCIVYGRKIGHARVRGTLYAHVTRVEIGERIRDPFGFENSELGIDVMRKKKSIGEEIRHISHCIIEKTICIYLYIYKEKKIGGRKNPYDRESGEFLHSIAYDV